MSVGTLKLGPFRLQVVLYDMYVLGRERRYLEAGVSSYSGGLVWPVRSRA